MLVFLSTIFSKIKNRAFVVPELGATVRQISSVLMTTEPGLGELPVSVLLFDV
jgi:hypothetical protein